MYYFGRVPLVQRTFPEVALQGSRVFLLGLPVIAGFAGVGLSSSCLGLPYRILRNYLGAYG